MLYGLLKAHTLRYVGNIYYGWGYLGLMKDQEGCRQEWKGGWWFVLGWMLGKSIMDEK